MELSCPFFSTAEQNTLKYCGTTSDEKKEKTLSSKSKFCNYFYDLSKRRVALDSILISLGLTEFGFGKIKLIYLHYLTIVMSYPFNMSLTTSSFEL